LSERLRASVFRRFDACKPGHCDGRPIRKPGDQLQVATHRGDVVAERRNQQIAALLEPRDTVLPDLESLADASLCQTMGSTEVSQRHLFGNELRCPGLNLLPASFAKFRHLVVQGLHCFFSFFNFSRYASNRLSAVRISWR
jgi:hypothetical protein